VGGIVGNLLTGIFAQSSIALYDGSTHIPGGWLDGNFVQIAYQLADSAAGFAYAFVVTVSISTCRPLGVELTVSILCARVAQTAILWMMHFVPGLRMRVDEETEIFGVDDTEMGETAYDYVNVETEINPMQTCTREMSARAESIASGM
jgi:Amt family ammonium transporter